MRIKNDAIEAANVINGIEKLMRFGKLSAASCNIIFTGICFPAAFLNCSTKSPINNIIANMIKVIRKVKKNFFSI